MKIYWVIIKFILLISAIKFILTSFNQLILISFLFGQNLCRFLLVSSAVLICTLCRMLCFCSKCFFKFQNLLVLICKLILIVLFLFVIDLFLFFNFLNFCSFIRMSKCIVIFSYQYQKEWMEITA